MSDVNSTTKMIPLRTLHGVYDLSLDQNHSSQVRQKRENLFVSV